MLENLEKRLQEIADKYQPKNAREVRVGITNAEVAKYATFVEFGWEQTTTPKQSRFLSAVSGAYIRPGSKLRCEPRPFFRGTFSACNKDWLKLFNKSVLASGVEQSLSKLGLQIKSDLQNTIAGGGTSQGAFSPRKPLTLTIYANEASSHKRDKTPGNYATPQPLVLTGTLLSSIGYELL